MHISDVHDYSPEPTEVVKEFIRQNRREQIKDVLEQLIDDEFYRLEEYADEFISQTAARRAERFLERVLEGNDDAAMALLGDKLGNDRYRSSGYHEGKPWASLIHGRLFETGGIALRKAIVEAHPELLKNERIADLESIVEGLTAQLRDFTAERDNLMERLRCYRETT